MNIPVPKTSVLDGFEQVGAPGGRRRWRSDGGQRLYEWDSLHGEIEVYNGRGRHLGTMDAQGAMIGPAIKGRTIDV
ncbi:MAG: colicin E3/pyocin S6 family cytotoxin [Janthinobacterium lividum]